MSYSKGIQINDEISKKIVEHATQIALKYGIGGISVKRIVSELGYTNRVFYNRFQNVNELLKVIYDNIVDEMRECIRIEYVPGTDFYEFLLDTASSVLKKTYQNKLHFSQYMFEYDSYNTSNRNWWIEQIEKLLNYGMENNLIQKTDVKLLSYSVWCFCRGFNTATIGTDLTFEEVEKSFKIGFECFIKGIKP